jgi:hypothetical protein
MIDAATTGPPAFDVIPVHSFSRFFRDQFQIEFCVRRLARAGVSLLRDATAARPIRKLTSYHPDIDAISSNYRQWLLSMSSHGVNCGRENSDDGPLTIDDANARGDCGPHLRAVSCRAEPVTCGPVEFVGNRLCQSTAVQ